MAIFSYTRPVAALLAGFIADKITPKGVLNSFCLFVTVLYFLSLFGIDNQITAIIYINLVVTMIGVLH